ncbi:MAG: TerB family tellurite resistance protein, partial [Anaerolineales bacterium]
WAELEIYMADPIGEEERQRLLQNLQKNLRSSKDKKLALRMLNDLVQADGEADPEEKQIAAEIEESIQDVGTGIFGQFGKLLQGPIDRRESKLHPGENREEYLEDFLRNRIYYHLRRMSDQGEIELEMPEAEVRRLSLAGGLLARIAAVDHEIANEEQSAIVRALQDKWDLDPKHAQSVAALALSEIETGLDFFRLSREFFEATDREERLRFIEALFQIGYSDGKLSHIEHEEIRHVARGLKLSHRQFIQAKMSVKP